MKKISLIVMSCMIACGLLANHGIVKGGEMSPKVEDTVSIAKKITDSQWLSNNSDALEVDTAGEDSVVPYDLSKVKGKEVFLNIDFRLKKAEPLMKAGQIVAYAQLAVKEKKC